MTTDEKIERLKDIVAEATESEDSVCYVTEEDKEPLEAAIKVLEQESILEKIRKDFISRYPHNYAGEPELGGRSCIFSLDEVLRIIDKYNIKEK